MLSTFPPSVFVILYFSIFCAFLIRVAQWQRSAAVVLQRQLNAEVNCLATEGDGCLVL